MQQWEVMIRLNTSDWRDLDHVERWVTEVFANDGIDIDVIMVMKRSPGITDSMGI